MCVFVCLSEFVCECVRECACVFLCVSECVFECVFMCMCVCECASVVASCCLWLVLLYESSTRPLDDRRALPIYPVLMMKV